MSLPGPTRRRRRRTAGAAALASATAVAVAVALAAMSTEARTPPGQLLLAPAIAGPGQRIRLSGSGLTPARRVNVRVGSRRYAARTTRLGALSLRFVMPRARLRRIAVEVERRRVALPLRTGARRSAHGFALAATTGARVLVDPAVLAAGSPLRILGAGFGTRARVVLEIGRGRRRGLRADRTGSFAARLSLPATRASRVRLTVRAQGVRLVGQLRVRRRRSPAVPTPSRPGPEPTVAGPGVTLAAAGDIACAASAAPAPDGSSCQQAATAALLDSLAPDAVAPLGDAQYETGGLADFRGSFDPTWGRFLSRMHPAAGNHEYGTANAGDYFAYFGSAAGDPTQGYYSYDLGTWHVIVLNSNANCAALPCAPGSAQESWLRADLASHPALCTLAYWHHPRFSSGLHGDQVNVAPFWDDLYAAGADVVLAGHDHDYERFRAQDPSGRLDASRGLVEFVVGTGGRSRYPFLSAPPSTSAVRDASSFGVLRLDLRPQGYAWAFFPAAGGRFTDVGSGRCHSL